MSLEVDNTDSHYTYASSWAIESASQQYGGSSHCASTDGASVTLHFRGKYITIYATIPTSTSPTFSEYTRIDFQLDNGSTFTLSQRALPGPIYSHPIYESSGLPETDHTLKLTFVDRPDTARFCLDRIGISSDIGSGYVPELLDPPAQRRGMGYAKREMVEDQLEFTGRAEFVVTPSTDLKAYTYEDMRTAVLTGGAFGALLVALIMLLAIWVVRRRRRVQGELKL
ncbi:hypothetical protein BKA70DRAFT_1355764 [Coprinopsis sp. MPI-PUGE-AT-0042]|nr:hypothetical protein BKA70DRAFT_1355764 [Coprinopsis sp. MPI-PUGE-AT-0042]